MQRIVSTDCPQGQFLRTFATLYEDLSARPFPRVVGGIVPGSLFDQKTFLLEGISPLVHEVYKQCGQPAPDGICVDEGGILSDTPSRKKVLLAFSGGKDSVAMALKLQAKGFEPVLYFVRGINKSYTEEIEYARLSASVLEMPLLVQSIVTEGKSSFVENPVKNFLILAMMVETGIRQGINLYAAGSDAHLGSTVNPEYDLSDAKELYQLLDVFYARYIPGYKSFLWIESATGAFHTIWLHKPSMFHHYEFSSCILPEFRKPNVRKANLAKGIRLEGSRCGSCNKCAKEYLHAVLFGVAPFDRAYAERCVEIIRAKDFQENSKPEEPFLDHEVFDIDFLKANMPTWFDFDKGSTAPFLDQLQRRAIPCLRM